MTAKEFLNSYKTETSKLRIYEEEIERLQTEAESVTQRIDGMPAAGKISDRVGNIASKMADLTIEAMIQRDKCTLARKEIINTIMRISRNEQIDVLYKRYINGMKWEEIAVDMNYNYRTVLKIHGRALVEIEKLLEDVK